MERDLENLKDFAVPPARADARRAAIEAALAAFDADDASGEKNQSATKDTTAPARLRETMKPPRSFLMNISKRQNMAIAASLAALVVAAPLAFKIHQDLETNTEATVAQKADEIGSVDQMQRATKKKQATVSIAKGEEKIAVVPEPAKPPMGRTEAGIKTHDERETSAGSVDGRDALRLAPPVPSPSPFFPTPGDYQPSTMAYQGLGAGGVPADSLAAMPPPPPAARDALGASERYAFDGSLPDRTKAISEYKDRDVFNAPEFNPIKQVAAEPVSTFSIDVDTASYSFMRRALNSGHLPPKGSVRVEELINYFPYNYPGPETADVPFKPTISVMPAPWKPTDKLVHIAIKGYDLKPAERPRANLVFLLDISGSMESEDRLPLVKNALHLLVDQLKPDDTVGIVTYASGSGIALEPTKISDKGKIFAAIDKLEAGGSTDGADGIADAYRLAEANFDKKAVNRIILSTDGDFNVGITDRDQLKSFVERKRASGIFLSILGVGEGNHNDALMQALAQNGNGTAAYVDTLNEARKVLVDEASSTLFTIAKDVKAQIEWNPARVSQYRLIGYETRVLKREDFNNDQVDAGDIGSGHTVTAIYEVTPVGAPGAVDDLRYGKLSASEKPSQPAADATELGFLKLRYKKPDGDASQLISVPVTDTLAKSDIRDVSTDVRFSVAVAAFGDLVRGAPFVGSYTYDDVVALAQTARGDDPFGYRAEFLNLARLAKSARP